MKTHLPRPGRNTSNVFPAPSCSARRRYHCIYLYLGWPRKWCRWPMMGSGAYGSVLLRDQRLRRRDTAHRLRHERAAQPTSPTRRNRAGRSNSISTESSSSVTDVTEGTTTPSSLGSTLQIRYPAETGDGVCARDRDCLYKRRGNWDWRSLDSSQSRVIFRQALCLM
jgi:hypothetical protein